MHALDGYGAAPALARFAARDLGLFAELERGAAGADELAARLGLWPGALARLLDVLELQGAVGRRQEGFAPVAGAAPAGPTPPAAELVALVLRRAAPLSEAELAAHPEARQLGVRPDLARTQAQAVEAAQLLAPLFAAPGWLADLGCGLGLYSAALLAAAPRARAILVDRSEILDQAYRVLRSFGARIELRPGDLLATELRVRPRVALLCDVLHVLDRDGRRALVGKAAASLEPGGKLFVAELARGSPKARLFAFAATILGGLDEAGGPDEIRDLCAAAGLGAVTPIACRANPDATFYLAATLSVSDSSPY